MANEENRALTESQRLGYDPDEGSDCTELASLDLKQKKELLQWQYLEGGSKIPRYIPHIPHVDETEIISSIIQDEELSTELARRLAGDAKQIMMEFIYAKQRFDTLQKEKELLKWHIASNSKVMRIKESEAIGAEERIRGTDERLRNLMEESERLYRERSSLSAKYKNDEADLEALSESLAIAQEEQQAWLSRRGDYIADTTLERRQASHERILKHRQWKKLQRACAVDKKWHVRIDAVRNADNMVFDAYEASTDMLPVAFDRAGDITNPIRQTLMEQIQEENPLEGFETTPMKRPTRTEDL